MPQVDSTWRPAMAANYAQHQSGLHQLSLEQLLGLRALLAKVAGRPNVQRRAVPQPLGQPLLQATPTPPRPTPAPLPVYSGPMTRSGILGIAPPQAPGRSAFAQPSVLAGLAATPAPPRRRARPPLRSAIGY